MDYISSAEYTAAYAYEASMAARRAQEKNASLEERIAALEDRVRGLEDQMDRANDRFWYHEHP